MACPVAQRRFDIYLAAPEEIALGRVLFYPNGTRIVIRERFERPDWECERRLPDPGGKPLYRYNATLGETAGEAAKSGSIDEIRAEITPSMRFFYGANRLPESTRC
jgi:hypothetical protein